MKQILFIGLVVGLLSACATPVLAPPEQRTKTYTIEHKLKKDEAFNRIQVWVAKNSGIKATRIADRTSGNIVLQANTNCDALPLNGGFAKEPAAWYSLDIKIQDKIVIMNFEDIRARTANAWDTGFQPSNQAETDKVADECLRPLSVAIDNELK